MFGRTAEVLRNEFDARRETLMLGEAIRTQYRNMPTAFIGSVVMSTLLLVVLKDVVSRGAAGAWLAVMYLQALGRYWLCKTYARRAPPAEEAPRWGLYAAVGAGVSGVIWGVGSVLLFTPGFLEYQLFLLFVLIGMGSSSVYASTSYMPAFHAFLYPAIVPVGVQLLMVNDLTHVLLGTMTFFYLPVTVRFAQNLNANFRESLMLRFENIELVDQLRLQKDAAERANTAKSRFLAAASHDLRQPMHAMTLYVERLRIETLSSVQQQIVGRLVNSVEALGSLFDALLDVSRLDAGIVATVRQHFPVARVLDRIRTDFAPIASAKGLHLAVVHSRLFVESDPDSLERILRNLVQNAVRYTDKGGIVIGCRRRGTHVHIEVWDSGPGIPADKHEEIFQEFFQLGNRERDRRKGLGLGLAIVERLARLLNHRLTLASRVGLGSRFAIEVPAGNESQSRISAPADALDTGFDFGRALVAVIDDEAEIQDAMRELLEQWNCEVVTAASGREMISQLAASARRPDFILCDFRLRDGETGPAVIADLREEFNHEIPALLVTGDTAPKLLEAEAQNIQVLHKPLRPVRLRTAMRRLIAAAPPPALGA
jgi:signal transduction histidine kinase